MSGTFKYNVLFDTLEIHIAWKLKLRDEVPLYQKRQDDKCHTVSVLREDTKKKNRCS